MTKRKTCRYRIDFFAPMFRPILVKIFGCGVHCFVAIFFFAICLARFLRQIFSEQSAVAFGPAILTQLVGFP